ncbi:MAG: DUF362 domain-containing protein [Planctomycetes bacterium]|nr:DUF362 domain-containing protein [Planctomycetota bacterium]
MLGVGGAVLFGGSIAAGLRQWTRHERGLRSDVFIGRADRYDADLTSLILEGLATLGIRRREIRGRRILLKPNLVETALGHAHINTHPSVVVAAAEAFRRLDAAEVIVAEGQGHRRDSRLVLDESGMGDALREAGLPFVDLNHDDFITTPNAGRWTSLESLYLPQTLARADWVVSLPKLKTHHWVGVTCAMKNLFGVMPGVVYGWPKNVLHYQGISESILDINATVRPALAIVDGIIGMEGDGPIMGSPKAAGCLLMGRNSVAVDATAVRVMDLNPYGVSYLTAASGLLGPVHEWNIAQRGESIDTVRTRFAVIDAPHLAGVVPS